MQRTETTDVLLFEEYKPISDTLANYGHVLLGVDLRHFVQESIKEDAVEQLHQRREGRTSFLPPNVLLPHKLTNKIVDALRTPVANPRATGVIGREALAGFLESYDAAIQIEG